MKIYYFNDTFDTIDIFVNDFTTTAISLECETGGFFDINLKENQIPFIKVWNNNIVLISGMDYKDDKS